MGLNFKFIDGEYSKAAWSYSGFHEFRIRLARQIGIDLDNMKGFGGEKRSWDTVNDPIKPFLNHSDCDGTLSPKDCAQIAPRLKELLAQWEPIDADAEHGIRHGAILVRDMETCAKTGQSFIFC
jgi:hypothetical protein